MLAPRLLVMNLFSCPIFFGKSCIADLYSFGSLSNASVKFSTRFLYKYLNDSSPIYSNASIFGLCSSKISSNCSLLIHYTSFQLYNLLYLNVDASFINSLFQHSIQMPHLVM